MSLLSFDPGSRLDLVEPADEAAASAPVLRTEAATDAGAMVETCDPEAVSQLSDAWRDLVGRALEPNVYLEPGFALAAAKHFAPAQRPVFLLVWAKPQAEAPPRLIGLCPINGDRTGFSAKVVTAWVHPQATLSAPLLDREQAAEALDALLDWVQRRSPECAGVLMAGVGLDGPLMRMLAERKYRVAVLDRRTRAVLARPDPDDAAPPETLSPKRAKELRRQQRRLGQEGDLKFRTARTAAGIRIAAEQFLELEARGWKGRKGTALLRDPGLSTFFRTMTRLLARDGKCRIHSLEVDGKPTAMGIVLSSGDRSYFWKTAYDESRGSRSPGKLFTQMLTADLLADLSVALTDSCAIPDHPMIDRMWRDRMVVADVLVGAASTPEHVFERAVRDLGFWRRCRQTAKATLHRVRQLAARVRAH